MNQPEVRLTASGRFALFDGMTWPLADGDLAYQLRYGTDAPSRTDLLYLASVVEAYQTLYSIPNDRRRHAVKRLRLAMKLRAEATPHQEAV